MGKKVAWIWDGSLVHPRIHIPEGLDKFVQSQGFFSARLNQFREFCIDV